MILTFGLIIIYVLNLRF